MKTILLDRTHWDLILDANRNIAVAEDPYQTLQDVASAVRAWLGEVYYDTSLGILFEENAFDGGYDLAAFANKAEIEAKKVPGVVRAQCIPNPPDRKKRQITGVVIVTMENGVTDYVSF